MENRAPLSNSARSPGPSPVLTLCGLTFLNALRERFYRGALFLAVFFFLLAYYLTLLSLAGPERVFLEVGFLSILLTGVLLIFYFGIFEFKRLEEGRGIHIFLSKPISRSDYIYGHLLGVTGVLWVYCAVSTFFLYAVYGLLFRAVIPGGLSAFLLVGAELTLLNVLALFASVLFGSSVISLFCFLSFFVAGHTIQEAYHLSTLGAKPATQTAIRLLYYTFPSLTHFDFSRVVIHQEYLTVREWLLLGGYAIVYFLIFLTISLLLFNRKEIE